MKVKKTVNYYARGIVLTIGFHLPVWKTGYRNSKYSILYDMPKWMRALIDLKNKHNKLNNDSWIWLKIGKLYVRDFYSYPCKPFKVSNKHLFVYKAN